MVSSLFLNNPTSWESLDDRNLYFGTDSRLPWNEGGKIILDDLRVYDRALSEDEILLLYGYGSGDVGIRPLVVGDSIFRLLPFHNRYSFGRRMQTSLYLV